MTIIEKMTLTSSVLFLLALAADTVFGAMKLEYSHPVRIAAANIGVVTAISFVLLAAAAVIIRIWR